MIVTSVLHFFAPQLSVGSSHSEEEEEEEEELCGGTRPHVNPIGWNKLRELLENFFPSCDLGCGPYMEDLPTELVEAIRTQLKERHLQCLPSLMEKVSASSLHCCYLIFA